MGLNVSQYTMLSLKLDHYSIWKFFLLWPIIPKVFTHLLPLIYANVLQELQYPTYKIQNILFIILIAFTAALGVVMDTSNI